MAGLQYRQHWQEAGPLPSGPVPAYQHDRRRDQRQWQENGHEQGPFERSYQQYNGHHTSRDHYHNAPPAPQTDYAHYGQWQGQDDYGPCSHQQQYYDNGYAQPHPEPVEYYDQGPPPTISGPQYDERYHRNDRGRPPLEHTGSGFSSGQRPPTGQRSAPSTPRKRIKPRDRILAEPTSPKTLAWDNPFGAFPAKNNKPEPERHASLDDEMKKMDLGGRRHSGSGDSRPHTSHGQRGHSRKDPPRPSTSHDRRPEATRTPPRDPPMPRVQGSPEADHRVSDRRMQGAMQSPRMRPPQPESWRDALPPEMGDRRIVGQYGQMDQYDSQTRYEDRQQYSQRPYHYEYSQNGNDASDHLSHPKAYDSSRAPTQPKEFPRQVLQHDIPVAAKRPILQSDPSRISKTTNDMPNFDAIPTEINEDHLVTGQQPSFNQQIYRKATYQAPGEISSQIDTAQNQPARSEEISSPLAEFSFDLPPSTNTPPITPRGIDNPSQNPYYLEDYAQQRNIDPRGVATGGYRNMQQPQPPATQFPPRSASRNGVKLPSAPNAPRPPPMPSNAPRHGSYGQDQYPARPHTSNAAQRPPPQSSTMHHAYGQEYPQQRAPSAPAVASNNISNYTPAGPNQPFRQTPGQGLPNRTMSEDNYRPGSSRAVQPNNAHPVPVRHYGSSNETRNPDALPAHPTPVRQVGNNASNGYPSGQITPAPPVQQRPPAGSATGSASGNSLPPVTVQELNNLREMYSRNPGDHALGLKLAKRMVEGAKYLSDENGTADTKTTQKNRERYIFDAHKIVKKLVGANYGDAMFYLADCHGQGLLGLAVDPKEAFLLYQSAAKLGHAQSGYRVAVCCELGTEEGGGTRRDPMKAMQWYKRAATLGDPPAMYKLGMILLKGLLGQPKNPREGVSWLKRAAERADKDNPHALHELGLLYESAAPSDHIVRDERYAFQLFQQAAELGYKYSQFRLGSASEYGLLGCSIDARQSIAWYTRAAAQGEHQSELALSGWYLTGSEPLLVQSDTEAFLWARKAASSGLAKAEYAMGYFYEVGIGTAVDVEEAKRWYYRAAAQNFGKARERLEELKRGQKMQKTRVSRSHVNRQSDGECVVM